MDPYCGANNDNHTGNNTKHKGTKPTRATRQNNKNVMRIYLQETQDTHTIVDDTQCRVNFNFNFNKLTTKVRVLKNILKTF
jgi:hypothetical protein